MNLLARIISVVFHPLLLATYLFLLFSFTLPAALSPVPASGHSSFIVLIFMVSFLLPALNLGIFKMMGTVKSLTMPTRHERILPFTFISILYCVVTYLFYTKFKIGLTENVLKLMLIIDALVVVATLVTYFYKISIHALGICGVLAIVLTLNKFTDKGQLLIPTIVLFVLTGIVLSARLFLNAHSPREVYLGSLVGLCIGFGGMLMLF